jgi:hypothetical protein
MICDGTMHKFHPKSCQNAYLLSQNAQNTPTFDRCLPMICNECDALRKYRTCLEAFYLCASVLLLLWRGSRSLLMKDYIFLYFVCLWKMQSQNTTPKKALAKVSKKKVPSQNHTASSDPDPFFPKNSHPTDAKWIQQRQAPFYQNFFFDLHPLII